MSRDEIDRRHRALLDHLPQTAVVVFDRELRFETVAGRALEDIEWDRDEVEGRTLAEVVPAEQVEPLTALYRRALAGESFEVEFRSGRDGRWYELRLAPIREDDGRVERALVVWHDIHDRRELEERLRRLAGHDDLTGLLNRRRFGEELERHLALAARHGDHGALLLLDVDRLKAVNDSRGHAAGDDLLRAAAAAMAGRLRTTDVLARFGGDEFAVLVVPARAREAERVAEALRVALRELVGCTASIGGVLTRAGPGAERLLAVADRAMYAAKRRGGDAVVLERG